MAWNPHPDVALARDIGKKTDQDIVIIFQIKGDLIKCASYGKTKELCAHAKRIADDLYERAIKQWEV